MSAEPLVSIILPVYNEAGHLEEELHRIIRSMDESTMPYEIIVVDDGSTDASAEVAAGFAGVRLLRMTINRGSGTARRAGTLLARGSVVVWTDADMTYPNDEIPALVKALEGHDQVVGARTSEEGTLKAIRVPAKWFIRRLAEYLSDTRIPDLNSGFRAFRRDVALQFLHLLPAGFSCVTTITMAFLSHGYSIKYLEIPYAPRAGKSKFHWWSDTRKYLLQVVRMVVTWNPMRFFMPLAAMSTLVGLAKLPFDLVKYDFRVPTNTLLALMTGGLVAMVGILADLVVQLNKARDIVPPRAWVLEEPGR